MLDGSAAGNRLKKLYDSDNEQTADRHTHAYDALNQLSTLTATGTPGDRIDVTGTVADDTVDGETVQVWRGRTTAISGHR